MNTKRGILYTIRVIREAKKKNKEYYEMLRISQTSMSGE